MSMVMRVARGSSRELERLAEAGGDAGAMPSAFEALLSRQRAAFANLTPERRAQLEAVLRAQPQLGALGPQVMEWLQSGFATARPRAQAAGTAGARRQRPASAAPMPETIDLHKSWHVLHFLFTG